MQVCNGGYVNKGFRGGLQLFDHLQFSADLKSRYSLPRCSFMEAEANPYPGLAFSEQPGNKTRNKCSLSKRAATCDSLASQRSPTDGRLGGLDVKSGIHNLVEVFSVEMQLILKFIGLCHHPDHPDAGSSNKRRY